MCVFTYNPYDLFKIKKCIKRLFLFLPRLLKGTSAFPSVLMMLSIRREWKPQIQTGIEIFIGHYQKWALILKP